MSSEDIVIRPHPNTPQEDFLRSGADVVIFGGSAGGGKALSLDTKVLTPTGWSTVDQLSVGDSVIDRFGHEQRITAEYPQPLKMLYEVEFRDGATVKTCGEHLWDVSFSGHKGVRNTLEIKGWMDRTGRNPTVPLYSPDSSEDFSVVEREDLPIDPYVLGFLLGDGHFSDCGSMRFTTADLEVVDFINEAGYSTTKYESSPYEYAIVGGLTPAVKMLGLYRSRSHTKFVPDIYKLADFDSRLAVLQGLMDSDGYREKTKANAEFVSVSRQLAEDVQYLVRSVGGTANMASKETSYTHKGEKRSGKTAYRLYIRHPDLESIFRLPRKKLPNKGQGKKRNAIVSVRECGMDYSKCFTVTGEESLFVVENFVVTHNSYSLLMEPLRYINVPDYYCLMFRRHLTEVTLPGGLVDESKKIYPLVGGVYSTSSKTWTFPSGAKVVLRGLELVDDVYQFKGVQVNEILWDELTGFEESQFEYLFSRIRSTNSIKGRVRASTNPQSEGWVKDIIKDHWLDDDGYAIPEMSGKIKWMVRVGGERRWYDSKEEAVRLGALDTGLPESDILPTSWTFIRSSLDQNPSLGADYKSKLLSMGEKDQMELLSGCWNFDSSTGIYFKREYLEEVTLHRLPRMKKIVRSWDLASSPVSDFNRNPDWSVGIKYGLGEDGYFYIMDMVRFRESIGEVKRRMLATANRDGTGVTIVIPQDPGGHGKHAFQDHVMNLSGFVVKKAKTEKSKLERFMPFASAAENGIVKIVQADWNHDLYLELERFIGDGKRKDDIVDSISDGHKAIHETHHIPDTLTLPNDMFMQDSIWQ